MLPAPKRKATTSRYSFARDEKLLTAPVTRLLPQPMNKKSLAEVALLTESEAAKMFNMGTTRFKARYVARDSQTNDSTTERCKMQKSAHDSYPN
jgi:hypothetical protein